MDAIKKKMQAMKIDKDGALERALVCEQQARDANLRAEKVCVVLKRFVKVNKNLLFLNRRKKKLVNCKRRSKLLRMN